jgi:hypothetical protein
MRDINVQMGKYINRYDTPSILNAAISTKPKSEPGIGR